MSHWQKLKSNTIKSPKQVEDCDALHPFSRGPALPRVTNQSSQWDPEAKGIRGDQDSAAGGWNLCPAGEDRKITPYRACGLSLGEAICPCLPVPAGQSVQAPTPQGA